MTPDELNDALDAMAAVAGDDPSKQPGLITAPADHNNEYGWWTS